MPRGGISVLDYLRSNLSALDDISQRVVDRSAEARDRITELATALRRTLVRVGVLRTDAAPSGPELLAAADHYNANPEGASAAAARSVRSLSDDQLLAALRNAGCHLDCDRCAEIFFTGGALQEVHTCPKGR